MTITKVDGIDRDSLANKIAERLRQSFVSGALAPGTKLVETEIAEQLGVSRNPLREALRILQAEGLVESRHNRGAYVAQLTEADLEEIYGLRLVLEVYAVRRAAERSTPEQADRLQSLVDEMNSATQSGDYGAAANIDLQLHAAIWEMSGHQRLLQILAGMRLQIRMFLTVNTQLYENLVVIAVSDHQKIVDAIRNHDGTAAAQLMETHIDLALRQTREFLRHGTIGVASGQPTGLVP